MSSLSFLMLYFLLLYPFILLVPLIIMFEVYHVIDGFSEPALVAVIFLLFSCFLFH